MKLPLSIEEQKELISRARLKLQELINDVYIHIFT